MKKIVIYTGHLCAYCTRAKNLFSNKNIEFEEINIHDQYDKMEDMIELSGGKRTVPQIFYGDIHIGGCDDLFNMDSSGELDKLINNDAK